MKKINIIYIAFLFVFLLMLFFTFQNLTITGNAVNFKSCNLALLGQSSCINGFWNICKIPPQCGFFEECKNNPQWFPNENICNVPPIDESAFEGYTLKEGYDVTGEFGGEGCMQAVYGARLCCYGNSYNIFYEDIPENKICPQTAICNPADCPEAYNKIENPIPAQTNLKSDINSDGVCEDMGCLNENKVGCVVEKSTSGTFFAISLYVFSSISS